MADAGRHDLDQHLAGLGTADLDGFDGQWLIGFPGNGGARFHECVSQCVFSDLLTIRIAARIVNQIGDISRHETALSQMIVFRFNIRNQWTWLGKNCQRRR